jgi:hypothetical protein
MVSVGSWPPVRLDHDYPRNISAPDTGPSLLHDEGNRDEQRGNDNAIRLSINLIAGWDPIRAISFSPQSPNRSPSLGGLRDERSAPSRDLLPFRVPTSLRRMVVLP